MGYLHVCALTDRGMQKSQCFKPLSCIYLNFEIKHRKREVEFVLMGKNKLGSLKLLVPEAPGFYKQKFSDISYVGEKIEVVVIFSVVPNVINDFFIDGYVKFDKEMINRKCSEYINMGTYSTILKPMDENSYVIK